MSVTKQQAAAYINGILKQYQEESESLSKHETRLLSKYLESQEFLKRVSTDTQNLQNQVRQGEARLRSLELQMQGEKGKADGFVEALISLKFDDDIDTTPRAESTKSSIKKLPKKRSSKKPKAPVPA